MEDKGVSLNKFISSTGFCSRREADQWIDQGRVSINGNKAKKGNRVFTNDKVTLDGKVIQKKVEDIYIKYNKPPGVTCTTDLRDRSNIIDRIDIDERVFPIGRLDKSSTGLILLTNNGDIVNKILRKENRHEKEYVVKVNKPITDAFLKRMSRPIPMLGTRTLPCKVRKIKNDVFKIILTQGLNRQIRRMCEFCDYGVVSLKRVRVMHINLGELKSGAWDHLSKDELDVLLKRIK